MRLALKKASAFVKPSKKADAPQLPGRKNLKEITMYQDQIVKQIRQTGPSDNAKSSDAIPVSPVQTQLQHQRNLLAELDSIANALIDPLSTVLTNDPRECTTLNDNSNPVPLPSCDLEMVLLKANAALESSIQRLREIRDAIRL